MPTQDERFDDIAGGQIARVVHAEMGEIVAEREAKIINELVTAYKSGKLSNELMLSRVAAISELRTILAGLANQIQKGIQATQIEMTQEE